MAAALLFTTVVCAVLFFCQLFRGVYLPMLWWYVRETLHFDGFGSVPIGLCLAAYIAAPVAVTWGVLRGACRAGATNGPKLIRILCAGLAFCRLVEQVSRSALVDLHVSAVGSGLAIALVAIALSCAAAEGAAQLLQASFGIVVGLYADTAVRGLFDTVDLSSMRGFFPVAFVLVISAMLWQMAVFLDRWNLPVSPTPALAAAAPLASFAVGVVCGLVTYASFACLQLQTWASLKSDGRISPQMSLVLVAAASAASVPVAFWTLPAHHRASQSLSTGAGSILRRDPSTFTLGSLLVSGLCAIVPPGVTAVAAVVQLIPMAAACVVAPFACLRPLMLASDGLPSASPVTTTADAPLQHVQGSLHSALRLAVGYIGSVTVAVLCHTAVVQTGAALNPHALVSLALALAFAVRCWTCQQGADPAATSPGLFRSLRAPWAAVVVFLALALANPWLARPPPHALASPQLPTPQLGVVRVASWNLHMGISSAYRVDIYDAAAAVVASHADVIGLQEVSRGQLTNGGCDMLYALSRRTGYATRIYGPSYELTAGDAILSRLPALQSGSRQMRRFAGTQRQFAWGVFELNVGEMSSVDGGVKEGAGVDTEARADPLTVLFVATHLHHTTGAKGVEQRLSQIAEISAFAAEEEIHSARVIVGDMNSPEGGAEGAAFGESGLQDAWLTCSNATAVGHGGATHPAVTPTVRLDWIMYSHLSCLEVEVVPTVASDHRLIVAVFDAPTRQRR